MAPKPKLIEDVVTKVPLRMLPIINRYPEYAYLSYTTRAFYGNATSIPKLLGGSAHGHVGMITKDILYAKIAATAPVTPSALVVPNNATWDHRDHLKEYTDEEHHIFDNATNMYGVF